VGVSVAVSIAVSVAVSVEASDPGKGAAFVASSEAAQDGRAIARRR
jgi:hypothetical protein